MTDKYPKQESNTMTDTLENETNYKQNDRLTWKIRQKHRMTDLHTKRDTRNLLKIQSFKYFQIQTINFKSSKNQTDRQTFLKIFQPPTTSRLK